MNAVILLSIALLVLLYLIPAQQPPSGNVQIAFLHVHLNATGCVLVVKVCVVVCSSVHGCIGTDLAQHC